MSIGVSAVGDIIAICLLAKDLAEALNSSRGAASEYREIRRELWDLEKSLLQVDLLFRTCDRSIELNALHETARAAAENCRDCIEPFLEKIRKYEGSLKDGGSGNRFKDAARKVQWQVLQSGDAVLFRAEIAAHCQSINMLLATMSVNALTINERKLSSRLTASEAKIEEELKKQSEALGEVSARLSESRTLLYSVSSRITTGFRFEWFRKLGAEMKTMMFKIFRTNIAIYDTVLAIQRTLPSHLERTFIEEPFILNDAIGRVSPVHMQFISSWDAFDAVLQWRFKNVQGYKKVQNKDYVFHDQISKREISRKRPWDGAFRPGQKVTMSLVFFRKRGRSEKQKTEVSTSCPNCQNVSENSQDMEVECTDCGLIYRRITEIHDDDPKPKPPTTQAVARPAFGKVEFGQNSCGDQRSGPQPATKYPPVSKKRKLNSSISIEEDDVANFKRVCLITLETRGLAISDPFMAHGKTTTDFPQFFNVLRREKVDNAWQEFYTKEDQLGFKHFETLDALCALAHTLHSVGEFSYKAERYLYSALEWMASPAIRNDYVRVLALLSSIVIVLEDRQMYEDADNLAAQPRDLSICRNHWPTEEFVCHFNEVLEQDNPTMTQEHISKYFGSILDKYFGSILDKYFDSIVIKLESEDITAYPIYGGFLHEILSDCGRNKLDFLDAYENWLGSLSDRFPGDLRFRLADAEAGDVGSVRADVPDFEDVDDLLGNIPRYMKEALASREKRLDDLCASLK